MSVEQRGMGGANMNRTGEPRDHRVIRACPGRTWKGQVDLGAIASKENCEHCDRGDACPLNK